MRAFGKRGLVHNRKIPHFGESCGENQALFLWAASLKQEPAEVIQESCLAPERGRNPLPLGGGGCQRNSFHFETLFFGGLNRIMPTSPPSELPSHNAAIVIRERIKEKRLFEAQFLFGLLDEDDVPAQERLVLERELDGLLAVVHDLQVQANKYIAEGEYVLARKMHREMERIAIDVPGLEYGKRQLEAQDQKSSNQSEAATLHEGTASSATAEDVPAHEPPRKVAISDRVGDWLDSLRAKDNALAGDTEANALGATERQETEADREDQEGEDEKPSKGRKLLALAALLLFLVLGLMFLNTMRNNSAHKAQNQQQNKENVEIKPLSVQSGEGSAEPGASSIRIRELTIEESSGQ